MLRAMRDKQRGIHKYLLVTWISRNAIWSTEIKRQEPKRKKGEKWVLIMFKWFGTLVKFVFRVKGSLHIPFQLVDHSLVISMRIFQKKQAWMWLCLTAPITLNSCQNEKHYGFVHFLLYIWTGISRCKRWNGFYFKWTHVSQPPANPFITSYWSAFAKPRLQWCVFVPLILQTGRMRCSTYFTSCVCFCSTYFTPWPKAGVGKRFL